MTDQNTKQIETLQYYFPTQIHLEKEVIEKIGEYSHGIAKRVIIIAIQNEILDIESLSLLKKNFDKHTKGAIIYDEIQDNPSLEDIDTLSHFIRKSKADTIVAFGGQNTIFSGKIGSLLGANNIFAEDIFAPSFSVKNPPLTCITIPTAPIMGEEVSSQVFFSDIDNKNFFYKNSPLLFPKMSFIDPSFFSYLSHVEIIKFSLSILSAAIEAIMSKKSNEFSLLNSMHTIKIIMSNLNRFLKNPADKKNIENISLASVFSGMSYSITGSGLNYALAFVINKLFAIDFFVLINILVPYVMEYNLTLRADAYVNITKNLGEDISGLSILEAAIKAIEVIRKLRVDLQLPVKLSELNIRQTHLTSIAEQTMNLDMVKNNSRDLEQEALEKILQAMM